MAKLTAAQERSIETVIYYLEKAQSFINEDETIFARKSQHASTTRHFIVPGEGPASAMAKDIGSELVCLQTGIEYLKNFLEFNVKKVG